MKKDKIETQRLIIRNLKKEDCYDWLEIFNSDLVGKYLIKYEKLEDIKKLIDKKIEKYKNLKGSSFSVLEKDNKKVIGSVEIIFNEENQTAEISYVFNDKYWNKGYATECALALIDYAFNDLNAKKVIADCRADNASSNHILTSKLKMQLIQTKEVFVKNLNKNIVFNYYEKTSNSF